VPGNAYRDAGVQGAVHNQRMSDVDLRWRGPFTSTEASWLHAQRSGIGQSLAELAVEEAKQAGCEWLHVDFDDDAAGFYLGRCGFQPTNAGLRYLQ
jgi:hypothetical protein